MEVVLSFDPFQYQRISDPKLSLNGSIVLRVLTHSNEFKQVVIFDNSTLQLPKEKVQLLLMAFKTQLDRYFN